MNRNYQQRRSGKQKNRMVAGFLSFFFGMFGLHKFYLNQTSQGIVYMLMFFFISLKSFPITAILGVIDAFRLFSMSDEQFHRKYNRGAYVNPRKQREDNRQRQQRNTGHQKRRKPSRKDIQRANPFKKSGIKKYKEYDLDGAITDFSKGLEINDSDMTLHFNIANAYSLTEQKDKAYYHIKKAVELGYNDFENINTKDDLAFVRIQPEWESFKASKYTMIASNKKSGQSEIPVATDDVLLSQLNKLAELRKKGLLSEEEFVLERKKLMTR